MRKYLCHLVAATCAIWTSSVRAETINQNLSIVQGKSLMIDAIYALKDDCSPGPFPQINVKKMPANGQIKAGRANFPISTDKNCPNVAANSLAISYFPYPNFAGEEKISANIVLPNGKQVEYNWTIKVNPRVESSLQVRPSSENTAARQ